MAERSVHVAFNSYVAVIPTDSAKARIDRAADFDGRLAPDPKIPDFPQTLI